MLAKTIKQLQIPHCPKAQLGARVGSVIVLSEDASVVISVRPQYLVEGHSARDEKWEACFDTMRQLTLFLLISPRCGEPLHATSCEV